MAETRVPVFFVRDFTCNQLAQRIENRRDTLWHCSRCDRLFDVTASKAFAPGVCPGCSGGQAAVLSMTPMTEAMMADQVGTQDGYRVCAHCGYAFFWSDEKCVTNEAGQILVPTFDPPGKKFVDRPHYGPAFYECPRCGREVE